MHIGYAYSILLQGFPQIGADDGNRTHVVCLEGSNSAIELRPLTDHRSLPNRDALTLHASLLSSAVFQREAI